MYCKYVLCSAKIMLWASGVTAFKADSIYLLSLDSILLRVLALVLFILFLSLFVFISIFFNTTATTTSVIKPKMHVQNSHVCIIKVKYDNLEDVSSNHRII